MNEEIPKLPEGKRFNAPSKDFYEGYSMSYEFGIEEGKKRLRAELKQLIGFYEDEQS